MRGMIALWRDFSGWGDATVDPSVQAQAILGIGRGGLAVTAKTPAILRLVDSVVRVVVDHVRTTLRPEVGLNRVVAMSQARDSLRS